MKLEETSILDKIKSRINIIDPTADVILFGSHARGSFNSESDWDILVLIDKPNLSLLDKKKYNDILFELELEFDQGISTFIYSKEEWRGKHSSTPFYENVMREGLLLK
jgi:predicted nucleotidyltransferase